jgi:serine/threonine-protein kinase RsbW
MNGAHPLGEGATRVVRLEIDSRLDHVELLGRAVRALCATSGVPARTCAHIELALDEAVNNVIRHAYKGEPGHRVEVVYTLADGRFTIDVIDEGTPMPERPTPTFDFDPTDVANLPEGGMGLFIIHSVMDHVEYASRDGRNALTMSRRLAA